MLTLFPARKLALFALWFTAVGAWASGVLPSTSVVVIEESSREAVIAITNTDSEPVLLLTTLEHIPQDQEELLQISPPVTRVDGGKKQTVRFLLTSTTPLKTERLRRVIFEGVPPSNQGSNQVRVNITQNLPVVIRPAGLARNNAPWKLLKWTYRSGQLTVSNPSPYVVRLAQGVQTRPDNTSWYLPQTYVLPSETLSLSRQGESAPLSLSRQGESAPLSPQQVHLSPATTWGFSVDSWDAALEP